MYSLLLKKTLPFALTFVVGSLIGGLFHSFGIGGREPRPARAYFYGYGEGRGRSCRARMRQRYLVAETKPLTILFKPDAILPAKVGGFKFTPDAMSAYVTFGADGKVHEVGPTSINLCVKTEDERSAKLAWDAVERAARQIQFEPEMVDGLPVSVTKEVKIGFLIQ
jgi:hypothetical protein